MAPLQSPLCHPGALATPTSAGFELLYRVSYLGGIALRCGPNVDDARTGAMLFHNEIFSVSETLPGLDGRIYLRLTDGRGWAFDDSALMPAEPSVVRGRWAPAPMMGMSPMGAAQMPMSPAAWDPMMAAAMPLVEEEKKKRRRRKRGGVKRRPKNKALTLVGQPWDEIEDSEVSEAEAEVRNVTTPSAKPSSSSEGHGESETEVPSDGRNTPTEEVSSQCGSSD